MAKSRQHGNPYGNQGAPALRLIRRFKDFAYSLKYIANCECCEQGSFFEHTGLCGSVAQNAVFYCQLNKLRGVADTQFVKRPPFIGADRFCVQR